MKKIITILLIAITISGCNKQTVNDNQNIDTENTNQNILNNNSEEINKFIQYPESTYQNWKTYTNQDYKFSISLSDSWQQIIDERLSIAGDIIFQNNSFQLINTDEDNKLDLYVRVWGDLCKNQDIISCYEKNNRRDIKFSKKENITTNGFEGVFLEYIIPSNISPESLPPYIYLFPNKINNNLVIFSFSKNSELTKQIIGTFRFFD